MRGASSDASGNGVGVGGAAGSGGLVLVLHKMCPFAQRAWLGLEESGLPYTLRECELYPKPKWLLEINPKGKVPVLMDEEGRPIVESEVIVDAIAARAPGLANESGDADAARRVSSWRRILNTELLPAGEGAKLGGRMEPLNRVLRKMDELVQGPFVAGDAFGVAEVSAAPMLQRLFEERLVPSDCARLHDWWRAVSERPAFQQTKLSPGSYWWWW